MMNQRQEIFKKNCGNESEFALVLIMVIAFLISELFFRIVVEAVNMSVPVLAVAQLFIWISLSLSVSIYYYTKKHEEII